MREARTGVRLATLEAAFAALAVAAGFVLAVVPNVELFTFIVFLSGVLLGSVSGIRVGILASIAYGLLSPYGLPGVPLLVALVVSRGVVGWLGGAMSPLLGADRDDPEGDADGLAIARRAAAWAMGGLIATAVFQALTTLAVAYTVGAWRATVLAAVPYAVVALVCNVLVFPLLGTHVHRVARRLPIPELSPRGGPRDEER